MSYIVIKTIKSRQYRYLQRSYRVGKQVRTESKCLGPVTPTNRSVAGKLHANDIGLGKGVYSELEIALAVGKTFERQRWAQERMRSRSPEEIQREDAMRHVLDSAREEARVSAVEQAHMEAKAARQTPQEAPQRTQEPPAKNFTVDDEIDAREAAFHATQEEVNAARGYDPAPTEPPDGASAPSGEQE